jgi:hypothetical protein
MAGQLGRVEGGRGRLDQDPELVARVERDALRAELLLLLGEQLTDPRISSTSFTRGA